jgi:hypothetical protein
MGSLFWWACSETSEMSPEELGYGYFPLKTGMYSIFQVEGVEYVNSEDSLEFSFQLKESVVDSFTNLESGISYKILREKRLNENEAWETDSVWTARRDDLTAIRVENNVPVISLTFPLSENKSWDANGLNSKATDEFKMVNIGQPFTGSYGSFDETVTVVQEDIPDRIVNFVSKKEIYSKDVGLVYKENIILNYKQGDFLGLEVVNSGIRYFQSVLEYGEE